MEPPRRRRRVASPVTPVGQLFSRVFTPFDPSEPSALPTSVCPSFPIVLAMPVVSRRPPLGFLTSADPKCPRPTTQTACDSDPPTPSSPTDPTWWDYMSAVYDDPDFVYGTDFTDLVPGPSSRGPHPPVVLPAPPRRLDAPLAIPSLRVQHAARPSSPRWVVGGGAPSGSSSSSTAVPPVIVID